MGTPGALPLAVVPAVAAMGLLSVASMVAHTLGLQLSGFAQLPFMYSGCTRFAQSGGTSVFPMAISRRPASKCVFRFGGSLR